MEKNLTDALPKYYRIKEAIKRDIINRDIAEGGLLPSEQEFSKQFHCAHLTVRRALDELVKEKLIEKFPKKRARLLKTPSLPDNQRGEAKELRNITIISSSNIYQSHNDSSSVLFQMLPQLLYSYGFVPNIVTMPMGVEEETFIAEYLQTQPATSGILLWSIYDDAVVSLVSKTNLPTVIIDYPADDIKVDCVTTDNRRIILQELQHLTGLGHKRIDFIGHYSHEKPDRDAQEQEMFWKIMCPDFGITGSSSYLNRLIEVSSNDIFDYIKQFKESKDKPTALCISNPGLARDIYTTMKKQKIKIPEDISIITCEETPEGHDTNLTTIRIDWCELVQMAIQRLDDLTRGLVQTGARLTHCGSLLDKGTTGVPAGGE